MNKIELQHKNEVAKLAQIETHLINLIAKTNNGVLMNKFFEWQEQRNECNSLYNEMLKELFK